MGDDHPIASPDRAGFGSSALAVDALILGAGPGGAEAARGLSAGGARVLVLDRASLDREKPCGGAVEVGELLEFGAPPEAVIERRISSMRTFGPDATRLDLDSRDADHTGLVVRRSVYDAWLQGRAVGARFLGGTRVRRVRRVRGLWHVAAETPDGPMTVEAPLLIHAAGAHAGDIDRALGLAPFAPADTGIAFQLWYPLGRAALDAAFGPALEMHFQPERVGEGYFWLFPKSDVVVAGVGTSVARLVNDGLSLRDELARFVHEELVARLDMPANLAPVHRDGGKIPMNLPRPLHGEGFLVVGDAAGLASIIHGGGIYQARLSGRAAAEAGLAWLAGAAAALPRYEARVRDEIDTRERRWDLRLRPFLLRPRVVSALLRAGHDDDDIRTGLGLLLSVPAAHRTAYELLEGAAFKIMAKELEALTATDRARIDAALAGLFPGDGELDVLAREALGAAGKRVRAVLVLLVGRALGAVDADLLPVALSYELSHTGSLIHDDIIDHGEWRRGQPALHRRHGLERALTVGDGLIIKSFELLTRYRDAPHIDRERLHALIATGCRGGLAATRGELADIGFDTAALERTDLDDYLAIIADKTGALIRAATEGGAVLAGADPGTVARMAEFGMDLGMAFQILDDAKDLLADEATSLKSAHSDVACGRLTAPLVHTARVADAADRRRLLELLRRGTREAAADVLALYRKYDAPGFSQTLARRYIDRAADAAAALPAGPARETLVRVVEILGYWTLLAPAAPASAPTPAPVPDQLAADA